MFPAFEFSDTTLMLIYLTIALLIPAVFVYLDNEQMHHNS